MRMAMREKKGKELPFLSVDTLTNDIITTLFACTMKKQKNVPFLGIPKAVGDRIRSSCP
jgi:hypothetical protein